MEHRREINLQQNAKKIFRFFIPSTKSLLSFELYLLSVPNSSTTWYQLLQRGILRMGKNYRRGRHRKGVKQQQQQPQPRRSDNEVVEDGKNYVSTILLRGNIKMEYVIR
jgi:hypothetical protein